MVATTATRGLSPSDLAGIRTTLAGGRKPKVVFTEAAGQIAGQIGQVIELMDPPVDEWVVVRFGRDELPFSPIDLAIPSRTARPSATRSKTRAVPPANPPLGRSAPTADIPYEPIATVPPPRQEAATMPAPAKSAQPARSAMPAKSAAPAAPASTVDVEVPAQPDGDVRPARKAARAPKVRPPASLTVTLSYTEGEWMVGAQQGTKALAKPYVIKAAEALRMVALLDVPGVHEAVEHIVEAERAQTQAHAERLRAELAEIEARLADLPSAKR
jgi:hypothetical protein